jgi:hypothetical protein
MKMIDIYGFVGILLAGIVLNFFISRRRHRQDLSFYLEPDLKKCGVVFVSATRPYGLLSCGPFPKIEIGEWKVTGNFTSSGVQTSGDYVEYRIVNFRDLQGQIHRLWALVEFDDYKFSRVRWRAERMDGLPASVLSILEKS